MIAAALAELGKKRLLLAIHDVSFPSDPDEDIGRGAPTTRAAARLLAYAANAGFTGIQLGPQGQTTRGNPSPYDATIFSRNIATIPFRDFVPVDGWLASGPTNHRHAWDASHALLAQVPIDAAKVAAFAARHPWVRDYVDEFADGVGEAGVSAWQAIAAEERFARYVMGQVLAHEAHDRLRAHTKQLGLALYGDLQVGYARVDAERHRAAFLRDYLMGAPPSRTNPDGQAWNYPVLDPDQLDAGAARDLVIARLDKAFSEYDSIRIDHPHGLVCPWVYSNDVRDGMRLFESPDRLPQYAIARDAQIDRSKPRYADDWVRDLDDAQVARYARLFDVIAACAAKHGRTMRDVSCEVLSTMPLPLGRVLARHGLGRWRVTQKANLDDARDVYRTENARPDDWVMLGNHDTAPIFALIGGWPAATRAKWIAHLAARLSPRAPRWDDDGYVAAAMLAELFACAAENVSIFFADWFGYTERFNAPGTVSDANWCLRLPPDFDAVHADRLARGGALDVPLALAIALEARGSQSGLAAVLHAQA